jgi:hypothetical protein
MIQYAHPTPIVPPDATRHLRSAERRSRVDAFGADYLGCDPRVSASHLEAAAGAREARLEIEGIPFGTSGCYVGRHVGAMIDCERMDAAGGYWSTVATCAACGSTVDRSEFVGHPPFEPLVYMMGGEG